MVQRLDPNSVSDLVLRAILLTGFVCLLRPNSYKSLTWDHVTFIPTVDAKGMVSMELVLRIPDCKSVGYAAALGGADRSVTLKEFAIPGLCVVRTLVALGMKMGLFELSLKQASQQGSFIVKTGFSFRQSGVGSSRPQRQ